MSAGSWRARFASWIDERVGWRKLMHEGLDEPIPGGSRWAYVFGSGLLFVLVNQIVTGVALTLYYVPSADHAHASVSFIQKEVTDGSFVRSLHAYGSSLMIIVLVLHLIQTYVYGAYKSSRELLWLFGCLLFLLVLGMSFTGYLLPWDQKAYSATAVATNMLSEIPGVGSGLKTFLRGGTEIGTVTISRFFTLHVLVIPAAIMGSIAAHVFLFRRAGAAGPPVPEEQRKTLPVEPFFPRQVYKDFLFGLLIICLLSALAHWRPTTIGPQANPADATYLPRPEWYYFPFFQWLKYWHGPASVIGIVIIPAALFLALFALPFIDRAPERRPFRRPIALGILIVVFTGLVFLGARSVLDDERDPAVRSKLIAQAEAEKRFAAAPFEPHETNVYAAKSRKMSEQESKGALLFVSESCFGCHGPEGRGGAGLFQLPDVSLKPAEELGALLRKPSPAMAAGGMEASALKGDEIGELVAYIRFATANRSKP
jgi:ubiquinol-cytochrome c reductase cytochrome b subunit